MISQTTEYALRAVVYLAMIPRAAKTTNKIASATLVPEAYLSKILQSLGKAKLVQSQKGLGGGFTLSKEPQFITVLDVINAVDPIKRIRECPLGIKTHGINLCPLHQKLDNAMQLVETAFTQSTIYDLIAEKTNSTPLCEIPVDFHLDNKMYNKFRIN